MFAFQRLKHLYNILIDSTFPAMIRKPTAAVLEYGSVAFLMFAILFADGIWATSPGFIGSASREIAAVCRNTATQWMLVSCLAVYFILFLVLEQRAWNETPFLRFINPNLWLAGLVLLALLPYALAYDTPSHSIQILVLIIGIVFGKVISTWVAGGLKIRQFIQNNHPQPISHLMSEGSVGLSLSESEMEKIRRIVGIIFILLVLLAASAFCQSESSMQYRYHGIRRWVGVWDNPNLYGLMMGMGVVLAAGQIVQSLMPKVQILQLGDGSWRKTLCVVLCSFAAILCGIGLFKSYSRGAWFATFSGLIYLAVQGVKSSRFSVWFRHNRLPLALLVVSLLLLAFWQFRFSEPRPAQRIFSVANVKDFSWRNRVAAWKGAVRMMINRPWIGFGWGQAETDYGKKYLSPRLNNESAAIEMNDYFMIGISAGIPALFCFAAYTWLSLKPRYTSHDHLTSLLDRRTNILTACRAGAIVLLVGFWFDGGLFRLPVTTMFWMLMELSRLELPAGDEVMNLASKSDNQLESSCGGACAKKKIWLRWLAGILAGLAVAQSTVYLGTPWLPVSDRTLVVARKCLIQQKEAEDFDFLSTNTIWRGIKLKVLLEHVRLANYNRQIVNWKLDYKMYQDFVLSPVITGNTGEQLDWRRPLWEEFYLRIRHESTPENAAKIVLRHLCECVTIATQPNPHREVSDIWLKQIADEAGFETIYVAALRSVGIPARLDLNRHAEFWNGIKWQAAPSPSVISLQQVSSD